MAGKCLFRAWGGLNTNGAAGGCAAASACKGQGPGGRPRGDAGQGRPGGLGVGKGFSLPKFSPASWGRALPYLCPARNLQASFPLGTRGRTSSRPGRVGSELRQFGAPWGQDLVCRAHHYIPRAMTVPGACTGYICIYVVSTGYICIYMYLYCDQKSVIQGLGVGVQP